MTALPEGYSVLDTTSATITIGMDFSHACKDAEEYIEFAGGTYKRGPLVAIPQGVANVFCSCREYRLCQIIPVWTEIDGKLGQRDYPVETGRDYSLFHGPTIGLAGTDRAKVVDAITRKKQRELDRARELVEEFKSSAALQSLQMGEWLGSTENEV